MREYRCTLEDIERVKRKFLKDIFFCDDKNDAIVAWTTKNNISENILLEENSIIYSAGGKEYLLSMRESNLIPDHLVLLTIPIDDIVSVDEAEERMYWERVLRYDIKVVSMDNIKITNNLSIWRIIL